MLGGLRVRLVAYVAMAAILVGLNSRADDIPPEQAEAMIRELLQSHIDANVPQPSDFDLFMKRDLRAYFSRPDSAVREVFYELLRDGPTQTGIAFPKFYVWVRIEGVPPRQGAARVAAIERQRFEVLQFVEKTQIAEDPAQLRSIFPPDVALAIEKRAQARAPK